MSAGAVKIIIVAVVLGLLGLDAFLFTDKIEGNTISQIVIAASHNYPAIPLAIGFLLGHWFGDF